MIADIPEIHSSPDSTKVPWATSVVWQTVTGDKEFYYWIEESDIQYVTWTNGNISITPHHNSFLTKYFNSIIIQGAVVFVGKKVSVG